MNNNFMMIKGLIFTIDMDELCEVVVAEDNNTDIPETYILHHVTRYGYMYFRELSVRILENGKKILDVSKDISIKTDDEDVVGEFDCIQIFDKTMIVVPDCLKAVANCFYKETVHNYMNYCKFMELEYNYGKYSDEKYDQLTSLMYYIRFIDQYFEEKSKLYCSHVNHIIPV